MGQPDAPEGQPAEGSSKASKVSRGALDAYYKQWEQKVAGMKQASAGIDWSGVDFSKLKPSDIGVHVGPVMTEEQFKEYRRRTGSAPHVIKGGSGSK